MESGWKSFATTAGLVAGGAYAAYRGLKQVYDLGKEGASLEYAAQKFDRLSKSIGVTSDALLNDLKKATKGTRSDMELMAGAGDLMALGLAKSYDEVVRLTRVVGGLGMDMNQLVLTLTNQTTMRFDQLGVSVDGFDAKVKALEKTGMNTNDAFKEAFLQQAEQQLARVGDIADTDAGKIARMESSVKNLGDSFKTWLAPGVADASDALNEFFDEDEKFNKNTADFLNNIFAGSFLETAPAKAARELAEANSTLTARLNAQYDAWKNLNPELVAGKGNFGGITDSIDPLKGKIDGLVNDSMKPLTDEMLQQKIMSTLTGEALLQYALSTGDLDEKSYGLLRGLQMLTEEFDTNKDGVIDAKEATEEYWDRLKKLDGTSVTTTIITEHIDRYQSVYLSPIYNGGTDYGNVYGTGDTGHESYASGGEFIIPPGYSETYPIGPHQTASSGEKVTVTPVGQTDSTDGIQIVMNNPIFTDPVEMESQVYRMVQDIIRRM